MKFNSTVRLAALLGLSTTLSPVALAGQVKEPHFDVLIQSLGGSLATAAIGEDGDPSSIIPGVRVFGAEMGEAPFAPGEGDEPGFQGFDFTQGTAFTFDILSALGEWNGAAFSSTATTMTVAASLADPGLPNITTGAGFVPGFVFNTAGADGSIHQHLELGLNAGTLGAPVGIYLLEIQVSAQGYGTTLPFWFVLNNGDSEAAHEAAIAYVEDNLVPAPGAVSMLALGGFAAARRRRS